MCKDLADEDRNKTGHVINDQRIRGLECGILDDMVVCQTKSTSYNKRNNKLYRTLNITIKMAFL